MKDVYVLRYPDGAFYCYFSVSRDQRTERLILAMMTENFNVATQISTRTGLKIFKLKPVLITDG